MMIKEKKTTNEKEFDTVKIFREIKEKISKEIKDMSYEELMEYFEKTKLKAVQNYLPQ